MAYQTKKRFGQHFLHDMSVIDSMLMHIQPHVADNIVEIGPGLGALTFPLLAQLNQLDVVELDRDIIKRLHDKKIDDLKIHESDVLKFDFETLVNEKSDYEKFRVVGNLPYNISTPIIFHLLNYSHQIIDMHFMLQKEVVNRLAATPNSKTYGRLSVMVQLECDVESLFEVPPEAFSPPPKVDSAIVRLTPKVSLPVTEKEHKAMRQLVLQAFSMRRKTIKNNLKKMISAEEIIDVDIDPKARAENLSVEDFVSLSKLFAQKNTQNT